MQRLDKEYDIVVNAATELVRATIRDVEGGTPLRVAANGTDIME